LSKGLVEAILAALDSSRREGARAVVIASSSSVFCAGADLTAMSQEPVGTAVSLKHTPLELFRALTEESRLVFAAVSGGAFGGGCELTMCCDAILAGPNAFFVMPELGHGVLPSTGLTRLPALIGVQKARELIFSRRRVGAHEARDLGLVSSVVGENAVVAAAVAAAQEIVGTAAPSVLAAAKAEMERWIGTDWSRVATNRTRYNPEERKEGSTAFVEKRPPSYERFWSELQTGPGAAREN
jgi:enoyl-CoA hydratase